MQLSKFEKLALWMLCDIYERVGADNLSATLIREAISTGNTWGIEWDFDGLFPEEKSPEIVTEVCDILDMWGFIEEASEHRFPGFDNNRETDHASVARFLTESMGRFETFKGRTGKGIMGLEGYRRMCARFEPIRATLADRNPVALSAEEIEELMAERVHPENR